MPSKVEEVVYECEGVELRAVVAYDPSESSPRPAVLIIHTAWGLSRYEIERAEALAEMGYVALAPSLYGQTVAEPTNDEEAIAAVTELMMLPDNQLGKRVEASLAALRGHEAADPDRVAAMGYCLGGTCVLNLARAGADVAGVISLHGGLARLPGVPLVEPFKSKVLVLHGWDDPYAPPASVLEIAKELTEMNADWQLHAYGGTGHAFADPYKSYTTPGVALQENAARRSWQALTNFLDELFPAR